MPTFSRWTEDPLLSGKAVYTFLRQPEHDFRLTPGEFVAGVLRNNARAAVLCNPNNPTGALMSRPDVLRVLEALSDLDVVVIDESFIDFSAEDNVPSVAGDVMQFPNQVYRAQANYVYVRMPDGIDGLTLRNHLLVTGGCLMRECGNKLGSDSRHFRIVARATTETDYLVDRLREAFTALGHRADARFANPPEPRPAQTVRSRLSSLELTPG